MLGMSVILYLIVHFILRHIIAKKFEQIAFAKGYGTEIHSYAMCFWLGILGGLYVIALPNATLDNITLKQQKRMLELLAKKEIEDDVFSAEDTNEELEIENPNEDILDTEILALADEIKKYKCLLDQAIITQEEFDAKKKQLLGL